MEVHLERLNSIEQYLDTFFAELNSLVSNEKIVIY